MRSPDTIATTTHALHAAAAYASPAENAALTALSKIQEPRVRRPLVGAASSPLPLVPSSTSSSPPSSYGVAMRATSIRTEPVSQERADSVQSVKPGEPVTTSPVHLPNETRVAAHAPQRLQHVEVEATTDYGNDNGESTDRSSDQQSLGKSTMYDTDNSSITSSECLLKTPDDVKERIREMRLGKRRRQRQQQKDELKYLVLRVEELEAHLARLRQHQSEFSEQTLVAARKLNVFPADAVSVREIWKQLTGFEREQLRTSLMENSRLRAQYECQLQIANGLKRLYESEDSFTVSGFHLNIHCSVLTARPYNRNCDRRCGRCSSHQIAVFWPRSPAMTT